MYITMRYIQIPIGLFGPFDWLIYTYFFDLGLLVIVVGQMRVRQFLLKREDKSSPTWIRRLVFSLLFITLTAATLMGVIGFKFEAVITDDSDSTREFLKVINTLRLVGRILGVVSVSALAIVMVMMMPCSVGVVMDWYRHRDVRHVDWVVATASCATCFLVALRIVPDFLRRAIFHRPSFTEHIILGVVPELIISCLWFALIILITRWEMESKSWDELVKGHLRITWLGIDGTPGILQMTKEYLHSPPELRQRLRFSRPYILCQAEKIVPGLLIQSGSAPISGVLADQTPYVNTMQLFLTAQVGRADFFAREGSPKDAVIADTAMTDEERLQERYDQEYDPAVSAAFLSLLSNLFEAALASFSMKDRPRDSVFRKPMWELDLELMEPKFNTFLITKYMYLAKDAESLTAGWFTRILEERGRRISGWKPVAQVVEVQQQAKEYVESSV